MTSAAAEIDEVSNTPSYDTIRDSLIDAASLVPVYLLPTETWVQIFLETLAMVISDRINEISTCRIHPTLAIASVCQRWRDIALDTPDLWGYIPIHGLMSPGSSSRLNGIAKMIGACTKSTKGLFIDFTSAFWPPGEIPATARVKVEAAVTSIERMTYSPGMQITIYMPSQTYGTLPVCSFAQRLQNYRFYNIFPVFPITYPNQVKSLSIHLRRTPGLDVTLSTLAQCSNLVHLELDYPCVYSFFPALYPMNPLLQTLTVRLRLMPTFFGTNWSISKWITSLHISLDDSVMILTPKDWALAVEESGLSTRLRFLGLEAVEGIPIAELPIGYLLVGLRGVVALALYGPVMGPGLDTLNARYTLLPALHRLEIVRACVDPTKVATFLDSPRDVSIGELVFDQCNGITQEFCEEMKEKVNRLIVRA